VAQVDAAVAAVGWHQARSQVAAVLPGVPLSGPRGRWPHLLRKRSGRRILAELAALPVQGRLPLVPGPASQPRRTVPNQEVIA